jgi:hypothetical protein
VISPVAPRTGAIKSHFLLQFTFSLHLDFSSSSTLELPREKITINCSKCNSQRQMVFQIQSFAKKKKWNEQTTEHAIRVQLFDLVSLFFVSYPTKFRFCYFHCRPLDCKASASMSFLTVLVLAFSLTYVFRPCGRKRENSFIVIFCSTTYVMDSSLGPSGSSTPAVGLQGKENK